MKRLMIKLAAAIGLTILGGCGAAPKTITTDALPDTWASAPHSQAVFAVDQAPVVTASTQPALPAGHPAIPTTKQPAASSGSLPAGHPDLSQKPPQNAGAAGAAIPDGVNLPAGHPDLATMQRAAA